jgi:hypothetical protein
VRTHNKQDSIRVEEPPQQQQKAPQTTINKNSTMKKPHKENPQKNPVRMCTKSKKTQQKAPQRKALQTTNKTPTIKKPHNLQ